jgi:nicotinamidase-related amidase
MPLTKLDTTTALIVIDLQKGIAGLPTVHPIGEVLKHAGALAEAFRSHGLPVVLVNVDGAAPGRTEQAPRIRDFPAGWTDLVPELNRQPEDHTVTKRTWGAFTNTGLGEHLKKLDVTQVVIAGVSTSAGVESTAREAHELGFNVTLAVDAMTDMNSDAHLNSVTRIFPRLGETGTTGEIIDLLKNGLRANTREKRNA